MKNKNIFQGGFYALFFLAFLTDSFGQNPILRSTTTGVPSLSGVTSSLITENGNFIGIGTASPTKRLTIHGYAVSGTPQPPVIRMEYNTFTLPSPMRNWELSANLNDFTLKYDNTGIVPINVQTNGTVNLMDKLYLNLPTGFNKLGLIVSSTKRQISWGDDLTGTPLEFMYDPNGTINDLSIMTMMPTGKIGIGTTAPSEKLEVSGGNAKVNNGNLIVNNGSVSIANGTFTVGNGSNQFKVYANGNVRAREVLIDLLTIPDYVFADKYPLMSLEELRSYIEKNKHLPGIQSEAEYKEQGHINVGELNVKLLEKVEELTLYILQLEEKMGKMNKEIEAINAQQK